MSPVQHFFMKNVVPQRCRCKGHESATWAQTATWNALGQLRLPQRLEDDKASKDDKLIRCGCCPGVSRRGWQWWGWAFVWVNQAQRYNIQFLAWRQRARAFPLVVSAACFTEQQVTACVGPLLLCSPVRSPLINLCSALAHLRLWYRNISALPIAILHVQKSAHKNVFKTNSF